MYTNVHKVEQMILLLKQIMFYYVNSIISIVYGCILSTFILLMVCADETNTKIKFMVQF